MNNCDVKAPAVKAGMDEVKSEVCEKVHDVKEKVGDKMSDIKEKAAAATDNIADKVKNFAADALENTSHKAHEWASKLKD